MNTKTINTILSFSGAPDARGFLSGDQILLPKATEVTIKHRLPFAPRFGLRFLIETRGISPVCYAYVGRHDLAAFPEEEQNGS